MKTLKIIFTGLLLVLATLTSEALAQDNVVEASADVIAAVAVVAERGLSFGDVFQGTNKTIAPSAATSGSVQFSGVMIKMSISHLHFQLLYQMEELKH